MKNLKIKFLITCFLLFLLALPSFCATTEGSVSEQITKIETSLWGTNYAKDTDSDRLSRIETEVLGAPNGKASIQDRINKLNSALGLESLAEANAPLSELYKEEIEGVNYPIVDMLELQLLGKNYKKENIYKRLERLEDKVFGATQSGDLAKRTDGLKARVAMMAPSSSMPNYDDDFYSSKPNNKPLVFGDSTEEDVIAKARQDAVNRRRSYNHNYGYGGSDASLQIAGLENSLFGQTFSYDPMEVRLNRLERRIFQRDFSTDDEYARLERLQAASTAKKTAKYYDNNKFQKFASTGMQLGTFVLMILALIL